jgi:protein-S-isoprenylcysteine O-methyltransferase Ste14
VTSPTRPFGGRHIAALGGALLFATSLAYFAFAYARRYALPADPSTNLAMAVTIDVLLFSVFALHHSVLARSGIKTRLAGVIPSALERTIYVWVASVLFIVVCAAWQLVPGTLWHVTGPAVWLLHAVQVGAVMVAIAAGRAVDVFEFAGVREALSRPAIDSRTPTSRGPYGVVRHPLYLAFLLAVWPMPLMTGTRLVFALVSTIYVLIAIPMEERDLRRTFGQDYDAYSERVKYRLLPGAY